MGLNFKELLRKDCVVTKNCNIKCHVVAFP